jgi:hypothetical protein
MKIECTDDELWDLYSGFNYAGTRETILPLLREVVKELSEQLSSHFFEYAEDMPTMEHVWEIEEAAKTLNRYGFKVTR